jgi:hypothetical protein
MGGNVGIAELVWTAVALVGAGFRLRGLIAAQRDVDAARELDAGAGIGLLTRARRRDEVCHLIVKLAFAAIGFYAMTQPNPPHPTLGTLLLTSVFIGAVALLALNSALQDRERSELRRYITRNPLPEEP